MPRVILVLFLLLLLSCDGRGGGEKSVGALENVSSAVGERDAFRNIREHSDGVTLWFYDKNGESLSVGDPELFEDVYLVEIKVGDNVVRHKVLDAQNLAILMRE